MTQKEIDKLKKENIKLKEDLKKMTIDRDSSIQMYRCFLEQARECGMALSVLIPIVNNRELTQLLAELYDLRSQQK